MNIITKRHLNIFRSPISVLTGSEDFYRIQLRTKHGEPILRKSWMIYRKESMQISLLKAFVDFIKERKLM
ncbi:hypothetical protein [Brevibacillus sp. MER 51]|uniref:hypothetical protein n=1 Tax=Brevibacillus sp. MER 51 TaxID=2939560 RepID=UPI00203C9986|nr:hypothetical protein [Brevibacillus sp. MER 51]MCM3146072.1 hypothetical protein [Brevibacillus sp. MER 51]